MNFGNKFLNFLKLKVHQKWLYDAPFSLTFMYNNFLLSFLPCLCKLWKTDF